MNQIAIMESLIEVIKKQLAISEAQANDLKCCGNCKLYYPECDYRGVLGYYYCDKWQSDGLTRKEREG